MIPNAAYTRVIAGAGALPIAISVDGSGALWAEVAEEIAYRVWCDIFDKAELDDFQCHEAVFEGCMISWWQDRPRANAFRGFNI